MAQYKTFIDQTSQVYTLLANSVRNQVRSNIFHTDFKLTSTGFSGTENTDWESRDPVTSPSTTGVYREGARDGAYVLDTALSETGFSGTENVDWENLIKYKPT